MNPGYPARLIPVLRARVTGVRGQDTNLKNYEEVRGQGGLGREFVITYRDQLEANERLVSGTFWGGASATPEVSIEDGIMRRFGVRLGDTMRFDVMGRAIEARVTSVRKVDWSDARSGGFMFVFRPGLFDAAPKTYIAAARAPAETTARARVQRDLVARYPNVSVIDIREIVTRVQAVAENITLAVSVVGLVALLSGLLILVGSVSMTRFQRLHEAAVFKTLGATTRTLAAMLAIEYSALGALAGTIGAAGSLALGWSFCRFVLDIPWSATPAIVVPGLLLTAALVGALGVGASMDVLRRKPLGTLRAE